MGNIEYCVNDRFNEINFYDLLDSPSSFLIDNKGENQFLLGYNLNHIYIGNLSYFINTFTINTEIKRTNAGGGINFHNYKFNDYERFYMDFLLSGKFKEISSGFKFGILKDKYLGSIYEEKTFNFSIMKEEKIGKLTNFINFDFNIITLTNINYYYLTNRNFYTFNISHIGKGKKSIFFFNAFLSNMYVEQIGLSFLSKLMLDALNKSNFLILIDYKRIETSFNFFKLLSGVSYDIKNLIFAFEGKCVMGIESGRSENLLFELKTGIEYPIKNKFFIRFGLNVVNVPSYIYYFYISPDLYNYFENYLFPISGTNLSMGIGVKEKYVNMDFILGYSISDNPDIYQNSLTTGFILYITY